MLRYRGRFAPSPTGALHVGGARTALCAWLRARSEEGAFVLRIEDLDAPRVLTLGESSLLSDLAWLGLHWDEGPDKPGNYGPYRQSERALFYDDAIDKLKRTNAAYPCTCTRKEIATIASAPHGADDEGPRYPGTCRNGPTRRDRPAADRFRMPDYAMAFEDRVLGPTRVESAKSNDFVVRRADGVVSYQLAVIVDDIAMRITEVVRGDDLVSSTPRQIALANALGVAPPSYAHVPLVLGPSGQRLSKRDGGATIAHARALGATPESVIGLIAQTLGLGNGSPVSPAWLIDRFDLARIPSAPTILTPKLWPFLERTL